MLKKYIEKITNTEIINYLEALNYEVESRKSILKFLCENKNTTPELFNSFFADYQTYYIEYDLAKKNFEKTYIAPKYNNFSTWSLNFQTQELTIMNKEDNL